METVPVLGGNDISALYEGPDGGLWIGVYSGHLVKYKDGQFSPFPVYDKRVFSQVKAIEEDRWGNLWVGSFTGGLFCFKGGKWVGQGEPGKQIRSIYKDGNKDLWVTAFTGAAKLCAPFTFQSCPTPGGMKTACLYEADKGNLWIGTGADGLFLIKDGKTVPRDIGFGNTPSPINVLYRDRANNLWIGTDGSGLKRLGSREGLDCGPVYSIYEDREGSLWIGTIDKGLIQLRDSRFITYTVDEGLSGDLVYCIHESPNGELFVGTKGGLSRFKDGTFSHVPIARGVLSNDSVTCLLDSSAGYLLIGTWGGLYKLENGTLSRMSSQNGLSLPDDRIKCIAEDRNGDTWIGTENGLNRVDRTSGKCEVFNTQKGLSGNAVEFIFEDSNGGIWVGTLSGLNYVKDGIIDRDKLPVEMRNDVSTCVYEDKGGILWFGIRGGLIRLQEDGAVQKAQRIYGVLGDIDISSILEDDYGYLWLSGRKGITCVSKRQLEDFVSKKVPRIHTEIYNEKDGMKSRCCAYPGYKTRDGALWFPTTKGVSMIEPGRIKEENPAPPVILEKMVMDGAPVNIRPGRIDPGEIVLGPGKKRFEFFYTAIDFMDPQKIRFKIKLEGCDSDWVEVGNLRSTTYNGLVPGHYTFKVTAGNQDGIWNPGGAAVSFYLRPYFYQAAWFYIIIVLFISAAVFSFYRVRVGRLKARAKELDELVRLRTAELEEQSGKLKEMDKIKSRFFANISHEFRTPLTLILGPLDQMLTGPQEKEYDQKKKMRMMQRNSRRLLGLINQLLELSKFDSGTMKLQAARQDIVPFLKGVFHSFDSLAVQNEIELLFQTQAEDIPLYYDPVRLEEVFSNLLSNAVKFTPAGGRITLAVKVPEVLPAKEGMEEQGFLEVFISDTGPGIPREELAHIFDRFYQADSTYEYHRQGTGIGLAIAREIVELHHGTITAHSPGIEGSGTLFVIRLPMGDAHLKPQEIVELSPVSPGNKSFLGVQGAILQKSPLVAEGIKSTDDAEEIETAEKVEETVQAPVSLEKDIILVIEDNLDVREYIRGALEPQYIVKEAGDGEEGVRLAGEIVPDLIICDVMMPRMDGFEVCRSLKNQIATSHIPVILLTAKAAEENIIRGLEAGADDYITKPFSTPILLARVKNLIDLRRQLQQNRSREMTLQPVKVSVSPRDEEFIKELNQAIEKDLSEPDLNVEALGKRLYMSHTPLYRKIHALTGESPGEYIRSYRLKRAAELLRADFGSVTDVAYEVGFSSTAYFTKCFKEKFHQLPSVYRAAS